MCDCETEHNKKVNRVLEEKGELIAIIETV